MLMPSMEVITHEIKMLEKEPERPEYILAVGQGIVRYMMYCERQGVDWRAGMTYDEEQKWECVLRKMVDWLEEVLNEKEGGHE